MKSLRSLQELIFPTRCLGCSALGLVICSQCRAYWHPHIYRQRSKNSPAIPIYSAISYSPMAGKILLAAKENGISQADALIYGALLHALQYFQREQGGDFLIPIPSRKSVSRQRGRQFVTALAMQVSATTGLAVENNLIHTRSVRDQSSLDAHRRQENIAKSLRSKNFLNNRAIIIDDLVTTGATLQESVRALRLSGIEVAGAVTACFAEPLR